MSGEKVFITMKKESNYVGRNDFEDRQDGDGSSVYAIVDHLIYGDEFCVGSLDDVRTFLGAYGDGSIFCRVRLFTLH